MAHRQSSSSEIQELDTANKKVDRYVHLVASLSEELDNLRRSICHDCKKKFVPSYSPVSSSSDGSGPRPSFWRRIVSTHQTQTALPSVLPTSTAVSTIRQNQTNLAILARPQASSSATPILKQPSTTSDDEKIQPSHIVSVRPTQTPSLALRLPPVLPTNTGSSPNVPVRIRSTTVQQNQANSVTLTRPQASSSTTSHPPTVGEIAEWSVSYNPNIKQSLRIEVVKTFTFTASVVCVKFSPDGKYLAVGTGAGSGRTFIYDVEKGLKICSIVDLYLKDQPLVWGIQFSPDNKYIAIGSDKIRIWGFAQKRTRLGFKSLYSVFGSLCFSPNGRFLVAGERRCVRIWSLRDGSSKTLLDIASPTYSITFSPDGRHIASVDFGGLLRIWDARTGHLLDTWSGDTQGVCVAFSPDGKGLVSGGKDMILRYWDVSSLADMEIGGGRMIGGYPGQRFPQIRTFEGHNSWIRSVSFSADFQWVATSSRDKSVRIWDRRTAEWQCTLLGHYPRMVDFSPTGEYLATGDRDKGVRLCKYKGV